MDILYASFSNSQMAERAVGALLDHGVKNKDITVIFEQPSQRSRIITSQVTHDFIRHAKVGITTTTSADAANGAVKGARIGFGIGTIGMIAALFVPGVGFVLGGGSLVMAIGTAAGTTAAGAIAGGVVGYLRDQGMSEDGDVQHDNLVQTGRDVIAITRHSGEITENRIRQILSKYQATDFSSYSCSK